MHVKIIFKNNENSKRGKQREQHNNFKEENIYEYFQNNFIKEE